MNFFKSKILFFLFVLSFSLFGQTKDTIYMSCPDTVYAGKSFVMELTIQFDIDIDRASYKQVLPIGFSAKDLSSPNELGYYFTNQNQTLKYSWLGKPTKKNFTLKYEVSIKEGINGLYLLDANFVALRADEKQKWTIDAKKIVVK